VTTPWWWTHKHGLRPLVLVVELVTNLFRSKTYYSNISDILVRYWINFLSLPLLLPVLSLPTKNRSQPSSWERDRTSTLPLPLPVLWLPSKTFLLREGEIGHRHYHVCQLTASRVYSMTSERDMISSFEMSWSTFTNTCLCLVEIYSVRVFLPSTRSLPT